MGRLYINPTLDKSIREYCELNGIEDVNAFANRCASQGLNIVKYGTSPSDNVSREINNTKDIIKNEKARKEKDSIGEDDRKQVSNETRDKGEKQQESVKQTEERKRQVTSRKIQIIKKG